MGITSDPKDILKFGKKTPSPKFALPIHYSSVCILCLEPSMRRAMSDRSSLRAYEFLNFISWFWLLPSTAPYPAVACQAAYSQPITSTLDRQMDSSSVSL